MVRVRKDRRGKDEKIRTDCKSNGVGIVCLPWRISRGTGISASEAVSGSTRTADTRGSLYGDRAGSVSVVYAGDFYEEGTTTPLITKLWTKIENWYPLGMYLKEHQEEEQHPVIEDESTCYEMIHANGNTIADRLLGENQSQAVTRENETARENEENDMSSQQEGEQEKTGMKKSNRREKQMRMSHRQQRMQAQQLHSFRRGLQQ